MTDRCCYCDTEVGEGSKVQRNTIDGELFCPRCAVTRRFVAEPERFNASQSCVAKCQFCHWTSVSFGALPGTPLQCGHCGKFGCVPVRLDSLPFTKREVDAAVSGVETAMEKSR
jgi:hypothetical protein